MQRLVSLGVFLLLVIVASAVAGRFAGGEWYAAMNQPQWSPPAFVMALVWSVLYVLSAVAAWMAWETGRGLARAALSWWLLQLLIGVCWSWMFFGLHRIGWALAVSFLWLLAVLVVIGSFRTIRIEASSLMMPQAAWLLFSLALGFSQWSLNGGGLGTMF